MTGPQSRVGRSAEQLLTGLDGPVVLVTGRVARVLMAQGGLADWRKAHRGDDPEVDRTLVALALVAIDYSNRLSANGRESAPITVTEADCALTTARAAARLHCSQRTVTRAIRNGHLPAQRVGRQWLISPDDVDRYAANRPDR